MRKIWKPAKLMKSDNSTLDLKDSDKVKTKNC